MKLILSTSTLFFICAITNAIAQEPHQYHLPLVWDFNAGGMTPVGQTTQTNNASGLIGGGAHIPIRTWVQWDGAFDFGFGNSGAGRALTFSDGSIQKTHDYQMILSTGLRFDLPLGHNGAVIGLGGGYAGVFQNEYVPDIVTNNGVTVTDTSYACSSCFRRSFSGPYGSVGLYKKGRGGDFGVFTRYIVSATNQAASVSPHQNWLLVGLTFGFRI